MSTWFFVPWIILALYVFSSPYSGLLDIENHLSRAYIIGTCLFDSAAPVCQNFVVRATAIPFFFADATLMLCLKLFSPELAGNVAVFLMLTALLAGWYLLCRSVSKTMNAGYIAGLFLMLNHFYYKGFYAFILGSGLQLIWMAWWWQRRDDHSFKTKIRLAAGLAFIFPFHLAPFVSAVVCYLLYDVHSYFFSEREQRMLVLRNSLRGWPVVLTFAALYIFQQIETGGWLFGHMGSQAFVADPSPQWAQVKFRRLFHVIVNHQKYIDAATLLSLALALICSISSQAWKAVVKDYWVWLAIVFVLLYFITPDITHGAIDVDLRFLFLAYFAFFTAMTRLAPLCRMSNTLCALLVLLNFSMNWYYKTPMNRELAIIDEALDQVPPGHSLVELNSKKSMPDGTWSLVNPYPHFGTRYIRRGGILVDGLFNCAMNKNMPYFCYSDPKHATVSFKNQFQGLPALEQTEIEELARDFDYILLIEPSAALVQKRLTKERFEPLFMKGEVHLFRSSH